MDNNNEYVESNFNNSFSHSKYRYQRKGFKNKDYQRKSEKYNKSTVECWNCGKKGHFASECKFKRNGKNNYKRYNSKETNKGRHITKHRN